MRKKIPIKASSMPKWSEAISDLPEDARQLINQRKKELEAHAQEINQCWSVREGSFWLRPIGVRLYEEIKKAYKAKLSSAMTTLFMGSLESTIDQWDSFIEKAVKIFRESKKYSSWEAKIRKRDSNVCKMCGRKRSTYIHMLVSLSEKIAEKVRDACSDIQGVDVSNDPYFFEPNQGLVLCSECYYPKWNDREYMIHKMRIEDASEEAYLHMYMETTPPHGIISKMAEVFREADKLFQDKNVTREWFANRLQKIKTLECELGRMPNGRDSVGMQSAKADLLLRAGEYESGKRWAIRQESFFRKYKENERQISKNLQADTFRDRNWEKVLGQYLDDLIEQYKLDRFSIRYSRSFGGYPNEVELAFIRDSENRARTKLGVPLIGEGWIKETEVYYIVKAMFPCFSVIHHARPAWLGGQEFDIYIPELNLVIEYMGKQHYEPVKMFGGEEGLRKTQAMDSKKLIKSQMNHTKILYIRHDEVLDENLIRGRIEKMLGDD